MNEPPKHNIYLCQVNNQYGNNVFLPNSVGMLQAYCLTIDKIKECFDFKGFLYLREDPQQVVDKLENPEIVGISCYVWNWEYNKVLASAIKKKYPECLIVLGGPHVPNQSDNFFLNHPFADILVHHEGELVFSEILLEYISPSPDYSQIPGLSVKVGVAQTLKTPSRERTLELSVLPSPYLDGVFDELLKNPYDFHASQETHRGCPYSCTFCDWGSAVMTKVRAFDDEKLTNEIEWFGKNKIDLLYNCDANYGMLPRDFDLTVTMTKVKSKYGFPNKFRAAYAKKSNNRIFEIAKVLNDSDMCKGVTLSFQSLDERTLELVKRKNIKVSDFENLLKKYREESIPTYTEIILGMPGETYESFVEGIDRLISAGQHEALNIYTCTVLPNSEMGDPEYIKKNGIETVKVPVLLIHSTPAEDPVTEYYNTVVQTNTMSRDDWKKTFMFSWAIQCFHCFSLTQYLAVFFHAEYGVSYTRFYEYLLEYARKNTFGLMGRQYELVSNLLERVLKGEAWDVIIPKYGNVVWPAEEATFLNLVDSKEEFYEEVKLFIEKFVENMGLDIQDDLLSDLLVYQSNMVKSPTSPRRIEFNIQHNLQDYFQHVFFGEKIPLENRYHRIEVYSDKGYSGNLEAFAKEVVWYGRKGGQFKHSNVNSIPAKSVFLKP